MGTAPHPHHHALTEDHLRAAAHSTEQMQRPSQGLGSAHTQQVFITRPPSPPQALCFLESPSQGMARQ